MWNELNRIPADEEEKQTELMGHMKTLLTVRNMLSRELNRLTI
jgi:hypothetical protein